jgi:Na+-transporting methylmalonyl-CoA/oxaloacetate decarboxylase gamma subunit
MEYGSRLRFALVVFGGILLLVLSIWGVTSVARRVIGTEDKTSETVKKVNLNDYNKGSSFVRVTVEGPIVASEKYRTYQIEVGQTFRDIKVMSGYEKKVIAEKHYTNDKKAYEAFLKALKFANFTAKNEDFGGDQTGYCATGNRYVYELFDGGESLQHTWNTSCNNSTGNFSGSGPTVRSLFKKQIPDFTEVTKGLNI